MSALTDQVGGDHYRNKSIQPVQFSMVNGLDACAHSILKYVTRHREKNGRRDLEKSLHFIELRRELATLDHQVTDWVISPEEYCRANRLPVLETAAIIGLGLWLETGQDIYASEIAGVLHELICTYDSTGE